MSGLVHNLFFESFKQSAGVGRNSVEFILQAVGRDDGILSVELGFAEDERQDGDKQVDVDQRGESFIRLPTSVESVLHFFQQSPRMVLSARRIEHSSQVRPVRLEPNITVQRPGNTHGYRLQGALLEPSCVQQADVAAHAGFLNPYFSIL